jgi:cell division initiation protein
MQITPEVIESKEFKTGLRGYDKKEVDIFLDEIIEEFEEVLNKNQKLKEEKDILLNQLAHYKKKENELNETLLKAQESAEKLITRAKAEYEAKMEKANSMLQNANADKYEQGKKLEEKYNTLKMKYLKYRNTIKNDLRKQLEILDRDIVE